MRKRLAGDGVVGPNGTRRNGDDDRTPIDFNAAPVWEIFRAAVFLLLGCLFLGIGFALHRGLKAGEDPWPSYTLFIIGSLLFVPGVYVSTLAFMAWRGKEGWTYDLIPQS